MAEKQVLQVRQVRTIDFQGVADRFAVPVPLAKEVHEPWEKRYTAQHDLPPLPILAFL